MNTVSQTVHSDYYETQIISKHNHKYELEQNQSLEPSVNAKSTMHGECSVQSTFITLIVSV